MVYSSNSCKIHAVQEAVLFLGEPFYWRQTYFVKKLKWALWSNKCEKFWVKQYLTDFFIAVLFGFIVLKCAVTVQGSHRVLPNFFFFDTGTTLWGSLLRSHGTRTQLDWNTVGHKRLNAGNVRSSMICPPSIILVSFPTNQILHPEVMLFFVSQTSAFELLQHVRPDKPVISYFSTFSLKISVSWNIIQPSLNWVIYPSKST